MNIQEYISSGVLELYAMKQLTAAESAEVDRMRNLYPELNAELEKIEISLERYSYSKAVNPPSYLKNKILQQIGAVTLTHNLNNDAPVKSTNFFKWAFAATVLLLAATAFFTANTVNEANNRARNLSECQGNAQKLVAALREIRNPGVRKILLPAKDSTQNYAAVAYWNPNTQALILDMNQLPALSDKDKQYQLWAIVDGKPVDAGVFDMSDDLQTMKSIGHAQAFAVTVEKRGGAASPDLKTMKVMGKV